MTSQPEKLFQQKLENFQRPVSARAWEKIESNLDKTHNKGIWLKIAASVLLLSVAAFILWPSTISDKSEMVAAKNENNASSKKIEGAKKVTAPIVVTEKIADPTVRAPKKKINKNIESAEKVEIENKESNLAAIAPIENQSTVIIAATQTSVHEEPTSSKTIVYTAEEVNSKYLRKKSPVEATSIDKKSSGMQKLFGLAYALKNDNGLSDLRQKKDEILALNFLTEDKTNKRKN